MSLTALFLLFPSIAYPEACRRNYEANAKDQVRDTYYENHTKQTLIHVLQKKREYRQCTRAHLSVFEVLTILDDFIDESDPDISLPQSAHAFQTAEAMRRDGQPRWLIFTGLIHDLGKILYLFGEPQWNVVGDTFPVGCAFDDSIVYHEFFKDNPDNKSPVLQTKLGIYEKGCGFDHLHMSFGHDEYLYQVMKPYLPEEALYIIRFHSFYPAHMYGAYSYFMSEKDIRMMPYLKRFQKYDLYSKEDNFPDVESLVPYYEELVREFLPEKIFW